LVSRYCGGVCQNCTTFVRVGSLQKRLNGKSQEVIESLIEWYQEQGKTLPEPIALPEKPLKVA
jgi:hypothetical protein